MTAALVSVADFRSWAGASVSTVPDHLIQQCLDEAEAGIAVDIDSTIDQVQGEPRALALATGEELRRAGRLLARRNSPEGILGYGELVATVPVRDPDSFRTISAIRSVLLVHEGVS